MWFWLLVKVLLYFVKHILQTIFVIWLFKEAPVILMKSDKMLVRSRSVQPIRAAHSVQPIRAALNCLFIWDAVSNCPMAEQRVVCMRSISAGNRGSNEDTGKMTTHKLPCTQDCISVGEGATSTHDVGCIHTDSWPMLRECRRWGMHWWVPAKHRQDDG